MEFTRERFEYTQQYTREVFGQQDAHLAGLMDEARAEGMPDIAVSPDVGRFLQLMVATTEGKLAIELGTLAGYSGIWLARGLKPGGKLISVELSEHHAAFAEKQFARAHVDDRVRVRRGAALDVLPQLAQELGPESVDVLFFDAIKREYPQYWAIAKPLLKRGGMLLADNVLGASWWIDQVGDSARDIVDGFNRAVASDADFDVSCVPLREGVLVARRR
jgi:predicted O-methyltransferase YrrM